MTTAIRPTSARTSAKKPAQKKGLKAADMGASEADPLAADLGPSLGTTAENCATRIPAGFADSKKPVYWSEADEETGEVLPFTVEVTRSREAIAKILKTPQKIRAERYMLKAAAAEILPNERVAKCLRWRKKDSAIQILKGKEHKKAFYSGLQVCASPWHCPVCSAKISERRREELRRALVQAKKLGLKVMLLTLTIRHGIGDDVRAITDKMLKGWRNVNSGTRAGKAFHKQIGFKGSIRAIEVTYGDNGFHPHIHALLFLDSDVSTATVQAGYSALWQTACPRLGLPAPSDKHGCKVDDGSFAAAYASKWGLESEMVKGHSKIAAGGKGMSPWDMLRAWIDNKDEKSRDLFKVYADAFKGRRQLHWSVGLKALLSVADMSDEEIVNQMDEPAYVLAELTVEEWRAIYKNKKESAVLDIAENNSDGLLDFIASLSLEPLVSYHPLVPHLL
jgi:Replication protein